MNTSLISNRLSPVLALLLSIFVTDLCAAPEWTSRLTQQSLNVTGDPGQDPATFPKTTAPLPKAIKRVRAAQPGMMEIGNETWKLAGGWRLQSFAKVTASIKDLATPGFDASDWLNATVPGTVLTSMVDEGLYPEPTYGLNNLAIPESLARCDYWYRDEFTVPASLAGKTLTLTFNGINYSADIWLNGERLGEIKGAFQRGSFDVSKMLRPGAPNALAVRVSPVPHPGIPHEESLTAGSGPNGGSMCFDGPTFFCSEGWDWIPGIRDRETGIWQDVVLHVSEALVMGDTRIVTTLPLPDTSRADVFITVPVENRGALEQNLVVRGEFEGAAFEQTLVLPAGGRGEIAAHVPVTNPRLWWPNGYGKPELYHLKLTVQDAAHRVLETKSQRFGIRQLSYELSAFDARGEVRRFEFDPTRAGAAEIINKRHEALRRNGETYIPTLVAQHESDPSLRFLNDTGLGTNLVVKVNGQRIVCKGGNWGLDEALKRIDRGRLEPYFRLEHDLGMTMIRNWCGQNFSEVFFELADEYGIMIWNDFWISTQGSNMEPGDPTLFLANVDDTIRRFRNHPSIVIWCGRNEGIPPPVLNEGIDRLVLNQDGTRYYIPSSIRINTLNSGPWHYDDPAMKFFSQFARGFNTEVGLPNPPTADAMRAMMPESDQWPISDTWAYHDWHQLKHGPVKSYMQAMARQYGEGRNLDDFCRKAQMMNYVGHRAMFEGLNATLWKPSSGRLIWMSHPTWPSMQWSLYSMDYDTGGSYFGARKACEPVHIQFNTHDRKVLVANTTLQALDGVCAKAELFDLSGKLLSSRQIVLTAAANAPTEAFLLNEESAAALPLCFLKLSLTAGDGRLLSDNFYWLPKRDEDHQILNTLPSVRLSGRVRRQDATHLEAEVTNPGPAVALLIKPTLRRANGERLLPAYVSDGGFSLLPGETRRFIIEAPEASGARQLSLDGWNTGSSSLPVPE